MFLAFLNANHEINRVAGDDGLIFRNIGQKSFIVIERPDIGKIGSRAVQISFQSDEVIDDPCPFLKPRSAIISSA